MAQDGEVFHIGNQQTISKFDDGHIKLTRFNNGQEVDQTLITTNDFKKLVKFVDEQLGITERHEAFAAAAEAEAEAEAEEDGEDPNDDDDDIYGLDFDDMTVAQLHQYIAHRELQDVNTKVNKPELIENIRAALLKLAEGEKVADTTGDA